ncbi:hypothetical protein AM228_13410 [Planktothricoides sp. SR001]|nr:hypothetical protein AM228_13410 [Planktothricoides sp. SR001]
MSLGGNLALAGDRAFYLPSFRLNKLPTEDIKLLDKKIIGQSLKILAILAHIFYNIFGDCPICI